MIDAMIAGRLTRAAELRVSKNGREYVTAQMAAAVDGDERVLVSLVAFATDAVQALQVLESGDSLCAAGRARLSAWSDKASGEPRAGLSVTVEKLLTPYHLRRKRQAAQGDDDGAEVGAHAPAPDRPVAARVASRSATPARERAPLQARLPVTTGGIADMPDDDPFGGTP